MLAKASIVFGVIATARAIQNKRSNADVRSDFRSRRDRPKEDILHDDRGCGDRIEPDPEGSRRNRSFPHAPVPPTTMGE